MTPEQQVLSEKLTNLQRLTVLGVVAGKSQRQAYYDAGGRAKNDAAADTSAYEILSRPEVREFQAAMTGDVAKEAQITLQTLLDELEEARQAALGKDDEKAQAAAMVAATMGKAKLLGLEAPSKLTLGGDADNPIVTVALDAEAYKKARADMMKNDDC